MTVRGHVVWLLLITTLGMYLGLRSNDATLPGSGDVTSCGAAWSEATSMACQAATSTSMTGSVLVLIVAGLTLVGLIVKLAKQEQGEEVIA